MIIAFDLYTVVAASGNAAAIDEDTLAAQSMSIACSYSFDWREVACAVYLFLDLLEHFLRARTGPWRESLAGRVAFHGPN